jgi:hypothetical protein
MEAALVEALTDALAHLGARRPDRGDHPAAEVAGSLAPTVHVEESGQPAQVRDHLVAQDLVEGRADRHESEQAKVRPVDVHDPSALGPAA